MKWHEISDKDKVQLVLKYVVPHDMGEHIVYARNDIHAPRGKDAKPVKYPIAAWDKALERWQTREGPGSNFTQTFDPLHDMNDTWKIVEKFRHVKIERMRNEYNEIRYDIYIFDDTIKNAYYPIADNLQDALCLCALRTCCVEIEL